jgi:hypothetical protein
MLSQGRIICTRGILLPLVLSCQVPIVAYLRIPLSGIRQCSHTKRVRLNSEKRIWSPAYSYSNLAILASLSNLFLFLWFINPFAVLYPYWAIGLGLPARWLVRNIKLDKTKHQLVIDFKVPTFLSVWWQQSLRTRTPFKSCFLLLFLDYSL